MIAERYLPTRLSKEKCRSLICLVLVLCFLDSFSANLQINEHLNTFLVPMLWLGLAFIVRSFPRFYPKAKLRLGNLLNWWALSFALIFIVVSIIAGFLDGFGRSPYSHTLRGMAINIIVVGSALVGREMVKNYLVRSLNNKENYFVFTLIALFITMTSFTLNRYLNLNSYEDIVKFVARDLGPMFCHNLLGTYFAFLGGAVPAIIYIGLVQAFHWLSPILPDLKWITSALIGILCPMFCLMTMQNIYGTEARIVNKRTKDKDSPWGWMITILVSIGITWFAAGVFPIYPSVILTGSMKPMIKPGDVIVVKKIVDTDLLNPGDVIQFKRDSIMISHRIMQVIDREGKKSYITKGDNNSTADFAPVKPEQIRGKIINVVPKAGWPTLLLRSKKDVPLSEIEF